LLLDEPTSGLELDEAEAAIETIRSIQAARVGDPLTVLFVEHNVPLIFNHCDRVTAMDRGTAVVSDVPEAVAANERVRESYLGIEVG
jgi:branched-chain amino acid transport system ATP-binding protein